MSNAVRARYSRVVTTSEGAVAGVERSGVTSYLGIPFAAPPVGDLRWRPPQPPARRSSELRATAYGAACPQPDREDGGGVGRLATQSEDCLTLNIWVPHTTSAAARLTRHGLDSWRRTSSWLGVSAPLRRNRAGAAGRRAGDDQLPARAARVFCAPGDHRERQAAGEDARQLRGDGSDRRAHVGAAEHRGVRRRSRQRHCLRRERRRGRHHLSAHAAESEGTFCQGDCRIRRRPAAAARSPNRRSAVLLTPRRSVSRRCDARRSQGEVANDWITAQGGLQGGLGFGPFVDGRLITEAPWPPFRDGRAHDVPLLIGANSNEASVLTTLGVPAAALSLALGNQRMAVPRDVRRVAVRGRVPPPGDGRRRLRRAIALGRGPGGRGAPSFLVLLLVRRDGAAQAVPGASHGSEIPYVFKTWRGTPLAKFLSDQDRAMSNTMSACWIAFATPERRPAQALRSGRPTRRRATSRWNLAKPLRSGSRPRRGLRHHRQSVPCRCRVATRLTKVA